MDRIAVIRIESEPKLDCDWAPEQVDFEPGFGLFLSLNSDRIVLKSAFDF